MNLNPKLKFGVNPWGDLYQLCRQKKYPIPHHQIYAQEGPDHDRTYTVVCKVGPLLAEYGKAKTKLIAKKCAAFLMIERIKNFGPGQGPYPKPDVIAEDDHEIVNEIHFLTFPSKRKKNLPSKETIIQKNMQLYKTHLGLTGSTLKAIKDPSFETENPEHFVHELENELNFKAYYWEIIENTSKNQYQCMVQLTLEPGAVLIGTGKTMEEARKESSKDVLNFFRKMTTPF